MECVIKMMKQVIFYLILFIFFHFPLFINSSDFDSNDYQAYGPTLAANDQFILAIQNRTGISFSAVLNYAATSPSYCSVTYVPPNGAELFVTMIAVGRNGLTSNNKFAFIAYSSNTVQTYLYIASIDFSPCQLTIINGTIIFNTTYPNYSVLGVNSDGTMAIYLSNQNIYIQNLNSYMTSNWSSIQINPSSTILVPVAIDLEDNWGVLAVYTQQSSSSSGFIPTLYVINFLNCFTYLNSSCVTFPEVWEMSYSAYWQYQQAPPNNVVNINYNSLYDMSVSINNNNGVLLGVQSVNTVFRFTATSTSLNYISSRFRSTIPSIGFGKGVGWLDNTTAAILLNNFTIDYIQWRSSNIELYPITSSNSLSNTISAYASFPNSRQQLWSGLTSQLINMLAIPGSGSLIYMDYNGNVQVILPSGAGYYTYTSNGIGEGNDTIYIAPKLQCSSGTIKNLSASGKDLFRYCLLCPEGSFYSANGSNKTNQCTTCNPATQFCSWGAVAALPISVLDTISQAQVYPETPENDQFEDILLINMFSVDFSTNCLTKQPLFFAIIIISIGAILLLLMGILKLTRKCKKQRRMIKSIFKQTDLIGEGEVRIKKNQTNM
jgi:hypothetical protein